MSEMNEKCPVCKTECSNCATICSFCGFTDEFGINRTWTIKEDLNNWLETVVKPYRASWEARKRENELSAQLEEAKKREAELLARVNSLANKETETTRILPHPQPPSGTHGGGSGNLAKIAIIAVSLGVVVLFLGLFKGWFNGSNKLETDVSAVTNVTAQSSMPKTQVTQIPANTQQPLVTQPPKTQALITQETFTDNRDSKTYKIIKIGTQTWMAENLNYNAIGSKCYNNNSSNCDRYGRLYNWETAKKACPSGWHLPSYVEWNVLIETVGGKLIAGKELKAKNGWKDNNGKTGNGTDEYGFSALPGGYGGSDDSFIGVGYGGNWWSTSELENDSYSAWIRRMGYDDDSADWAISYKSTLFSVRCLRGSIGESSEPNKPSMPKTPATQIPANTQQPKVTQPTKTQTSITQGTFTDSRDSKKYKIVKIGTQTWMSENLNYNASGSKCYNNYSSNCDRYGRLYNWETAKKACPNGWHLPSDKEWQTLIDFAGGEKIAGKKLKAKNVWNDYEGKSGSGTNDYGFSALPGGSGYSDGSFLNVGGGLWWSATEYDAYNAYLRNMSYNYDGVSRSYGSSLSNLLSVRCVQDKA